MAHFTPDYLKFLKELAANNNRDWFQANKPRYEKSVKLPFESFVAKLIQKLKKIDPALGIEVKDAVFRIYRDVRFGKDKTPYKTSMSAIVAPGGRKGHKLPGIYVEIGPADVRCYSGVYMTEKEDLFKIRTHIAKNDKAFQKLATNKKFVDNFGEIRGEKNKVIPKEFKEAFASQPLIANKSFYYFAKFPSKIVSDPKLADKFVALFKIAQPLNKFFMEGLGK